MKEMLQFVEALHFVVAPKAAQQLSPQYQTVLRNWNTREEELNINAVRDLYCISTNDLAFNLHLCAAHSYVVCSSNTMDHDHLRTLF